PVRSRAPDSNGTRSMPTASGPAPAISSTIEAHSPHSGHLPSHRTVRYPQLPQTCSTLATFAALAMQRTVAGPSDVAGAGAFAARAGHAKLRRGGGARCARQSSVEEAG